jgi:hypothetical protein
MNPIRTGGRCGCGQERTVANVGFPVGHRGARSSHFNVTPKVTIQRDVHRWHVAMRLSSRFRVPAPRGHVRQRRFEGLKPRNDLHTVQSLANSTAPILA